ncbi:hypothetical protein FIBSPDRAFT_859308, partial [Athelia psychrophila]
LNPNSAKVTTRPRAATLAAKPSDNEAADLMLFLATSPSPVRPAGIRDRGEAHLSLGGGKGRVLFAGGMAREDSQSSFTSGVGSINSSSAGDVDMRDLSVQTNNQDNDAAHSGVNIIPPTPTDQHPASNALLPPPPSPPHAAKEAAPAPASAPMHGLPFNLNDFINTSPLPPASTPAVPRAAAGVGKGRRLFEEHAMQGVEHQPGLGAGIDLMK